MLMRVSPGLIVSGQCRCRQVVAVSSVVCVFLPAMKVCAIGRGLKALIWRTICSALLFFQSIKVSALHFCGVCGSFARLCLRFLQCRVWFGKELIQQFACDGGELLFQFAGCGGLLDCQWMGSDDVAFVQGFCHTHQTDPGLSVSGKNGAFNGRGSPPAWQQRVVDVHAAEFWCVQYGAGKQSSVGDYDEEVYRKLAPSTC